MRDEKGRLGVLFFALRILRRPLVSSIKNGGIEPPFSAFSFDITSRCAAG
jgi:hypothetical protein